MTAKNAALRLLSIKSRSVLELRKKLTTRGYPPEEIEAAIQACQTYGYLNDQQESERRSERLKRKGYGPRFITAKLRTQGLEVASASKAEQIEAIRALIQKTNWQKKERRNLIAALQRRGFDFESILAVIKE